MCVCTCASTKTGSLLWVGCEAGLTLAVEGALGVHTATIQTNTGLHTLIHVWGERQSGAGVVSKRNTHMRTHMYVH